MGKSLLANTRIGIAGLSAIAVLAGGISATLSPTASAAVSEAEEPVQILSLTNSAGVPSEVATAGTEDIDAALSVSGNAIVPQLSTGLTRLMLAGENSEEPSEGNTALLTEPLAVDEFLVAGITWNGNEHLAEGTEIYMRVREGETWSEWYLTEEETDAFDGESEVSGTEPFVSGGADAVQIWVTGDETDLPGGMDVSLIPANTNGDEEEVENPETLSAEPTEIAPEDEELDGSSGSAEDDDAVELPTVSQTEEAEDTADDSAEELTEVANAESTATAVEESGEDSGTSSGEKA